MSDDPHEHMMLRVSLLDRLIDNDPSESSEVPWDEHQKLSIIKQGVRRDLQDLLNTRYRCVSWPPESPDLEQSLINYGLPDFTAASMNVAYNTDVLLTAMHRAIALFEPRLTDVRIEPLMDEYHVDRTFRFRIEATLLIEHHRHTLQFDSSLEPTTGQINVGKSDA